ncbi:hypothetical protein [Corynebacterium hansenii]|nr:hypothetical protein [Corynebacterium hansenii]
MEASGGEKAIVLNRLINRLNPRPAPFRPAAAPNPWQSIAMKTKSTSIRVAAALLGATGLLLASCGAGGAQRDAAPSPAAGSSESETRSTVTVTSTVEREIIDVDASAFAIGGGHVFRYVLDGESGECSIGERGAMCMGTAGDDIPEVEVPPFPRKPASAVSVGVDGTEYLVFEGVPPAPETLQAGQRVKVGKSVCSVPDESTLTCEYDGASFTLRGADALISTSEKPVGRYFVGDSGKAGESGKKKSGAQKMSATGDSCGTARSSEFPGFDGMNVEVKQGPVDCGKAMEVLGEYLDTPTDADHGNANIRQYGDWSCAMPTHGSAQRSGYSLTCGGSDGTAIGIRNG